MKTAFIKLERSHFEPIGPVKGRFILQPFPEEAGALHEEWVSKLKVMLGETRGVLLDDMVRTPPDPRRMRGMWGEAFNWLRLGTNALDISIVVDHVNERGVPVVHVKARTSEGGEESFGAVPLDRMSPRWRHLLTPDLLSKP